MQNALARQAMMHGVGARERERERPEREKKEREGGRDVSPIAVNKEKRSVPGEGRRIPLPEV